MKASQQTPLKGCVAKIARSREHFDQLKRETAEFFQTNLSRIGEDPLEIIESLIAPPVRFGLILGDMIHNLRCALDYLAWELAKVNLEREPSRRTQFTIANSAAEFARLSRHQLADLSEVDRVIVEEMQPYHAPQPEWHPVTWLRQLSNGDKHQALRLIVGVSANILSMDLSSGKSDLADMDRNWAWFIGEVQGRARVTVRPLEPDGTEREVLMYPVFHLALDDDTPLNDVVDEMIPAVEGIVEAFEQRFAASGR